MEKTVVEVNQIRNYLAAGFSGFVIKTTEAKRAERLLSDIISTYKRRDGGTYNISKWDLLSKDANPMSPINSLKSLPVNSVAILNNYHWHFNKPQVVQLLQNSMEGFKGQSKAIVIIAAEEKLPVEIRKDFAIMELPLPKADEIGASIDALIDGLNKDLKSQKKDLIVLSDEKRTDVIEACKGLTETEMENALSLSLVTAGELDVDIINDQKIHTIEKSGLLQVMKTKKTFADIRGYDRAKMVVSKMIKNPDSRGVLFTGPPGCGKTLFAECVVGEFKKIGILLNFGSLFSKYQGEGHANVEEVIRIIKAIGNCVVIIDEFEKQFAGAGSTGETDSGVAKRMTGRWLRFMSDEKPPGAYFIGTCNSFQGIPDEYFRVKRWDSSPFFIDLPNEEEKLDILNFHASRNNVLVDTKNLPNMYEWTGAEIEGCCEMAKNLNVPLVEASAFIVPQNRGGFKEAEKMKNICIQASSNILSTLSSGGRRIDA